MIKLKIMYKVYSNALKTKYDINIEFKTNNKKELKIKTKEDSLTFEKSNLVALIVSDYYYSIYNIILFHAFITNKYRGTYREIYALQNNIFIHFAEEYDYHTVFNRLFFTKTGLYSVCASKVDAFNEFYLLLKRTLFDKVLLNQYLTEMIHPYCAIVKYKYLCDFRLCI